MELPLKNTQINVKNGYRLVNQSRFQTDYSYTITEKSNVTSEHDLIELSGTTVFSGGTPLSLIDAEIVSSEIKNWGEFTAYTSIVVLNEKEEELVIRPIINGTEVILSSKNSVSGEETEVCSYGYIGSEGMPEGLSFAINVGRIKYSPKTNKFRSLCTFYAINGQSGCGDIGIGNLYLLIDSYSQPFGNKTYTVTQNAERKEI